MISGESDIPPGGWLPEMKETVEPKREPLLIEARPRPNLVARYSLFRENFHPKADVMYYPCGANDISPSSVFPGSRIMYCDIDEQSMKALKKSGFETHTASALEFNPGNVDILIMLNPVIPPDVPSSYVVQDGYALCNDYHGTASSLWRNNEFQLRAVIRTLSEEKHVLDMENLEDYFKEIDTEEEFQNAPLDWGAVHYDTAAVVVEAVTGKKEHVLAEYKKIIALAGDQQQPGNPDNDVLIFEHQGKQFILKTNFPRKKGTVDDIFVFQKVGSPAS